MKLIFVATKNHAKFEEIKNILNRYGVITQMPSVDMDFAEGIISYKKNAGMKALYLNQRLNCDALGEDSGIEIPVLGGFPGVMSARFIKGSDSDRNTALLDKIKSLRTTDRKAVFKSYTVIILKDGTYLAGYGEVRGIIIDKPAGNNGFGYDPIFVPDGYDKTLAQLTQSEKNNISHRKTAIMTVMKKYTAHINI